ncbi:MAG: transcriptional repressor LexA [Rhodanobacteraceae bacterium]|nr:MAG: transcriptional repressor LexA [Rhodanobacteraceae bacterium]
MAPTPAQLKVLRFLRDHIIRRGYPPSVREIQHAFGFASPNAAAKHLHALAAQGLLELAGRARGIRLLGGALPAADTLTLPLIGKVAAGMPILVEAHVERNLSLDRSLFKPEPDYLLRVVGDSMIDAGILDADLIAIRHTPEARNGQIVVARVDGAVTVKVFRRDHRGVHLMPRNPAYSAIEVDATSDFAIEGLYCGLVRGA